MIFLMLEFLDGLDDPCEKVHEEGDEEELAEKVDDGVAGCRPHCGATTVRFACAFSLASYWQ